MGKRSINQEIKNQLIGMYRSKIKICDIAHTLSISQSCVRRNVNKWRLTGSTRDKFRCGAPRKTSRYDDNILFRTARKQPTLSCQQLANELNLALDNPISRSTVSRRLRERGLFSYTAVRKPTLKQSDLKIRKEFCKHILSLSDDEIKQFVFSDESNFKLVNRKNKTFIRRFKSEKYHKKFLAPRVQAGGGSIGFWGCIGYKSPGLSKWFDGSLDRHKYIDILENCLIPSRDLFGFVANEWIFLQDGAPAHRAKIVKEWFADNGVSTIKWPPRSPDLNVIENAWAVLDNELKKQPVHSLDELKARLNMLFMGLSGEYCRKLFDSLKTRCLLCLKNKGGHIPY